MLVHDVLVVGGGLAGLMAALQARNVDVAVATKVYPTQSHSGAAQGGFNAARGDPDSVEAHVFDTIKGSDYLADQDAVEVMCSEASEVIDELDRLGALWSRTDDGRIAQRALGGSSYPRACYAADLSGHVVLHTLYAVVAFADPGSKEVYRFEVRDFPTVVIIDAYGHLHETAWPGWPRISCTGGG